MNTELALVSSALSSNSLSSYMQEVQKISMLSAEEERELATRLQYENNLDAARKLVLAHLRFVVRIAKGYSGYGLPLPDLIQEGNVGLMKAVNRFDVNVGVRLVSFAVHWVRAEIHEYVLRNWRIVKVATTKAQRKLFFNLRSSKKRLGWFTPEEVEGVANDLGVSPKVVLEMEARLSHRDVAFDLQEDESENGLPAQISPAAYLENKSPEPSLQLEAMEWEAHRNQQLYQELGHLDARSQDILRRRWLNEGKSTLQELADEYGISAERIRQLEKNALKKMRMAIEA